MLGSREGKAWKATNPPIAARAGATSVSLWAAPLSCSSFDLALQTYGMHHAPRPKPGAAPPGVVKKSVQKEWDDHGLPPPRKLDTPSLVRVVAPEGPWSPGPGQLHLTRLKAGQIWPVLLPLGGTAKICLPLYPDHERTHSSGCSSDPRGRHSAGEKQGWEYPFAVWH